MLNLQLQREDEKPIYLQIYDGIKKAIIQGQFEREGKLPSIRQLSFSLGVSKTTTETAYQQLLMEGYIFSRPKSGYYANPIDGEVFGVGALATGKMVAFEITKEPQYDFWNEYSSIDSFDFALWRKYLNKVLGTDHRRFLSYGSPQGEWDLREEIALYARKSRGVICTPEQVVIGAGTQSLLGILAIILKEKHISIGFEDPGFIQGRQIFKGYGFKIVPISLEEDGISIASLTKSNTRVVYVSPSNQFPMGAVMPVSKRARLLNWVHQREGLIIEDDYDSELRYFGRPIPSLQGMDEGKQVVYLGSFSKILLPSLRISYMVLPPELLNFYRMIKGSYNQTASPMEQAALALFMREGQLERHLRKIRKIYAKKNQLLLDTIKRVMGEKVTVFGGETGLHILLKLKTKMPVGEVVDKAAKVGVRVNPLSNYTLQDPDDSYPVVILAYGGVPLEDIEPGVGLLHQVWFS